MSCPWGSCYDTDDTSYSLLIDSYIQKIFMQKTLCSYLGYSDIKEMSLPSKSSDLVRTSKLVREVKTMFQVLKLRLSIGCFENGGGGCSAQIRGRRGRASAFRGEMQHEIKDDSLGSSMSLMNSGEVE